MQGRVSQAKTAAMADYRTTALPELLRPNMVLHRTPLVEITLQGWVALFGLFAGELYH